MNIRGKIIFGSKRRWAFNTHSEFLKAITVCDYRKSDSSPAHFHREQVAGNDGVASFLIILIAYFFLLITYGLVGHDMCVMCGLL